MSIRIAGEPVKVGDRLYSRRAAAWGQITSVSDFSAVMSITKGERTRTYTVTEGGSIAGSRDVYWHLPLALDLPKSQLQKLAKLQAVVDAVSGVL